MGWRGINIEPVPKVFERLCAERPRDINLNVGISNRHDTLSFYECSSESTFSTFSPALANHWKVHHGHVFHERQVAVTTLAQVCEQYVREQIDFLSIDAENLERQVIEGHNWARWRPRIVLLEDSISAETGRRGHETWEPLLLRANYLFGFLDGINRFYVRREDEHLLPLLMPAYSSDDYVAYEKLLWTQEVDALTQEVDALRARLRVYGELGPTALRLAKSLRRLSVRHPALAKATKCVMGFAWPVPQG
jgi:FkbM family methyltransferase